MLLINTYNNNVSIFKKKQYLFIYIYNNNYVCIFYIRNIIKINFLAKNTLQLKIFKNNTILQNKVNFFLKQFQLYEKCKIKFSGKGYKIKKSNESSINLVFNRAHMTKLFFRHIFLKKLKKYKIYIRYTKFYKEILETIIGVRPVNIFTKKGLRKSRQLLLKKKGKNK